jgi:hypothetical protein
MCALVGYIATGRTDISATLIPTPTVTLTLPPSTGNSESWAMSDGGASQSATLVAIPASTVISSILPVTSSDLGLTIFDPPDSLSFIESPPPQTPQPSSSDSPSSSSLGSPRAKHNLEDPSQDIMSRPNQDVLAISHDSELSVPVPSSSSTTTPTAKPGVKLQARLSESHGKGKGRETIEDILYDLSFQLSSSVSSVSQALDMDFIHALADSFNREVSEILSLLDQFVREIKSHGVSFLEDPKRAVKKLKKKLTRGNKQAKKNAKNIVDIGERFFEIVKTNIETAASTTHGTEEGEVKKSGKGSRGARAKERALRMHKKVFKSEEWLKHQRAVAERRAGALQIH